MTEVREERFRLYQNDPNVAVSDGTAAIFTDIWTYTVPVGEALILKPEHTFAAYVEDASTQVGNATCRIRIEKRDPSGSDKQQVYEDFYYGSKEFQEKSKMAHLLVSSDGVIIGEREKLVITINDDGTIDESDSYFELHIARVRKTLGT